MTTWRLIAGSLGVTMLVGCQTMPPPAPVVAPAPPAPAPVVTVPSTPPEDEWRRLMASEPAEERVSPAVAAKAVTWAQTRAIVRPRREDFRGAVVQYPYTPGTIYEVLTKLRQPTTLMFPPGEVVKNPNDTTDDWFTVTLYEMGAGATKQANLIITPLNTERQSSRMTVVTSKAVYFLALESTANGPSMTAVSWLHPEVPKRKPQTWAAGVYQTGYDINVTAGSPVWTPTRVWANPDRGQMLIEFPPAKLTHSAPMIYVLGPDGKQAQLVNWRDKGRFYEIDQLAERMELRVGHDPKANEVVTITIGTPALIRCPGDAWCPQMDPVMEAAR